MLATVRPGHNRCRYEPRALLARRASTNLYHVTEATLHRCSLITAGIAHCGCGYSTAYTQRALRRARRDPLGRGGASEFNGTSLALGTPVLLTTFLITRADHRLTVASASLGIRKSAGLKMCLAISDNSFPVADRGPGGRRPMAPIGRELQPTYRRNP